jgi:hypothetical protein
LEEIAMSAPTNSSQCRCGRPLHPYWLREEQGAQRVYTQEPIIPGPSSTATASDVGEVRIALGLQPGTLVHDVHFESDPARDRQGTCMESISG